MPVTRTKTRVRAGRSAIVTPITAPQSGSEPQAPVVAPGTTGRYLILMKEDAKRGGVKALSERTGVQVASTSDFENGGIGAAQLGGEEGLFFETLGVAVVKTPPEAIHALSVEMSDDNPILAVEPERIVYALGAGTVTIGAELPPAPPTAPSLQPGLSGDYLRGYRDAVNHLVDRLLGGVVTDEATEQAVGAIANETELTWGLQVTKAGGSRFSGKGIRVAVLDTGMDLGHPDFASRAVVSKSFVPGQQVQDGHGHGTHCIGTSCGPRRPGQLPRYGIAYNADIYAGKVLSNQGSGPDANILAGLEWAIKNSCAVVSMSLGSPVNPGGGYSQVFEQVAKRAMQRGTLIIAAAGNDSHRPAYLSPVSHPANCPSIMAVAAIDPQMQIAFFSNGGLNPQGGQVDIAAPGVRVRSSWPRPDLYKVLQGTSMACPHVAGIAALLAEANPNSRGTGLQALLLQTARRLSLPGRDVGSGLVQAP